MTKILYNVTHNEGEPSSVTVFVGADSFVATPDHANFRAIIDLLEGGCTDPEKIKSMWNVGASIAHEFRKLSERVSFGSGVLYFDGDPMNDALAQAIIRFIAEGNDDYKPLVAFTEKIALNPNPHSREHLFRWMRDKSIGICPDGDFIAYKGIDADDRSKHAGQARVNGVLHDGKIPNKPDTVIEMPRSKVTFDPRNGCSTGLHAGNWSYARGFAGGGKVVVVKINPRDVVSVPSDSNDEKLRVCRYKVLRTVQAEDRSPLFVPDVERLAKVPTAPPAAPKPERKRPAKPQAKKPAPKAKPAPKPKPEIKFPAYYEQFTKKHFEACNLSELRFVAKEFEISPIPKDKATLIDALLKEGRRRKRTW